MAPIKITKPSTIIGSVLLILIALFHGSGIGYVTNLMVKSNAEPFLKEIFPILFILPTLQLLGLAIFGLLTLGMQHEVKKILFLIAILVIVNSILALYLGAIVPSVLLFFSSFAFTVGGIKTT
ncbi:hypothetical protein [Flagellimonas flava]|uniref:DoxX-like family protein n=1 Tax=Flagellimonas flava TaxID=570519 RepID=A0A1M5IJG1_9FLAO|nr:hypothetical protein [Allomuricauda flava]SHG28401.1 hypothetical protein SAMN04488116_0747 [Allomuricauda flava]